MNKTLGWKLGLIVATLVVFLFGIFGIPKDFSGSGLLASLQEHIHLGLDLKGGTHLILQVQVNDAVNGDSDRALERVKEDLRTHKINYTEISKPDPINHPDQIVLKGVPPESTSDLRSIVSERLPEYDLNSGADNSWTFTMKPQALAELKNRAVTLAIETIRNRIDQLGVTEPVIQEHGLGQYQILVQLPGVDDPARVKEIMQSTAMLEIKQVLGGPYLQRAGRVAATQWRAASGFHAAARTQRRQPEQRRCGRAVLPGNPQLSGGGRRFAVGRRYRGTRFQYQFTRRGFRSDQ